METTKDKTKPNRSSHRLVAGVLLLFFLLSVSGSWLKPAFTSPDEVVNYYAASAFIQRGSFILGQALPEDQAGIIKPRNVQVADGQLVPLSYLGFPFIIGSVGRITGEVGLRWLTPLAVTLALAAYFVLVRDYFGDFRARLSLVIAATFPSVLFFTYKAMWHNAMFVSLLILSIYFIRLAAQKKVWAAAAAGLLGGLAIIVRPNEIVWIVPLLVVILLFSRYRLHRKYLITVALFIIIALATMLIMNNSTFGEPLSFGYTLAMERQGSIEAGTSWLGSAGRLLIPAKVTAANYLNNINWYGWGFAPFHFLLGLAGLATLLFKPDRAMARWLIWAGLGSLWLVLYYFGTEYFGGQTTVAQPTVGASYLRYLLPATFLLIPFVALGLDILGQIKRQNRNGTAFIWVMMIALSVIGLSRFIFDNEAGLLKYLKTDVPGTESARQEIIEKTPPDAVIISGRKDKLFFPYRLAVMGYNDVEPRHLDALSNILGRYEVYYNDVVGRDYITWSAEANKYGFILEPAGYIGPDPLYHFVPKTNE